MKNLLTIAFVSMIGCDGDQAIVGDTEATNSWSASSTTQEDGSATIELAVGGEEEVVSLEVAQSNNGNLDNGDDHDRPDDAGAELQGSAEATPEALMSCGAIDGTPIPCGEAMCELPGQSPFPGSSGWGGWVGRIGNHLADAECANLCDECGADDDLYAPFPYGFGGGSIVDFCLCVYN